MNRLAPTALLALTLAVVGCASARHPLPAPIMSAAVAQMTAAQWQQRGDSLVMRFQNIASPYRTAIANARTDARTSANRTTLISATVGIVAAVLAPNPAKWVGAGGSFVSAFVSYAGAQSVVSDAVSTCVKQFDAGVAAWKAADLTTADSAAAGYRALNTTLGGVVQACPEFGRAWTT